MRSSRWILAICTVSVALLMVMPAADALDTGFNEADTPVFLAAPSLSRVRPLVPPVRFASLPAESVMQLASGPTRLVHGSKRSFLVQFSDNRQPILCTFLI
ncbi:MAG TPA: hypothetical protein VKB49_00805 [Candidatus Sulfotelmatobacter sp.]|jgi:hypothetical protein|nr:hypothetical protein [Candidatus Sulfotelmatobacter sp.]